MKPDIPLVIKPGATVGSGNVTDAVRAAHRGDLSMPVETTWKAPGEFDVRLAPAVGAFIAANPAVEEERLTAALGAPVRVAGVRRDGGTAVVALRVPHARRSAPSTPGARPAGPAAAAPAAAIPYPTGGTSMPATTIPAVAAHWRQVASDAADFEPGSDAELLEWMSSEVAGMLGYGESVAELHEHCLTSVRADPAAMAALHDVADAAADCAEAMARAMAKFREIYEAPREFVGEGGVLPKDGDWLQGDDA
jgi:hypothetical protein